MRIARVSVAGTVAFGVVEGDGVSDPMRFRPMRGHPFGELDLTDGTLALDAARLLPPVLPSKVIGIGKNYADHAAEMAADVPAEPLLFLKPSTTVIGHGDAIRLPEQSQRVDFEAELAVVIGRLCRSVAPEDAAGVVLGYTCGNDVTARDLQAADGQWTRAKSFDTFCPLGPWIETQPPEATAELHCEVNGEVRQRAVLRDMIFDVPALVAHVSSVMTLLPGDVILTGTPAGIGPLHDGDSVKVGVAGIGSLSNEVVLGD